MPKILAGVQLHANRKVCNLLFSNLRDEDTLIGKLHNDLAPGIYFGIDFL